MASVMHLTISPVRDELFQICSMIIFCGSYSILVNDNVIHIESIQCSNGYSLMYYISQFITQLIL